MAAPLSASPRLDSPSLVVRARGLSRAFDGRGVLNDIDVEIRAGEFVALLGRARSGKSTVLRILARLDQEFDGELALPDRVGVVFQDARLLPWARVLDNVLLGQPGQEQRARGLQLLDEVGLTDRGYAWPRDLTSGEAQRAALGRALVGQPELVLMDEPFGALDALTRIRMHRLLRTLIGRYGPAVLLVTHDVDEAVLLADRILVLTEGALASDIQIDLPRRGRRCHPRFAELRSHLLDELRVGDDCLP